MKDVRRMEQFQLRVAFQYPPPKGIYFSDGDTKIQPYCPFSPILFIIYFTMDGLDIDDDSFVPSLYLSHSQNMSLSKAQQVIHEQNERIRTLEDIEERYHRLQREFDRMKSDLSHSQQIHNAYAVHSVILSYR